MAYSYPEIKQFRGLHLQQNSLTVPDGALETATNVVISRDGVISKRRGFYQFFAPSVGTLNRLFTFQDVLLAAFETKISYLTETGTAPNKTGAETVLSGQTVAISGGRVSRAVESNRNFYFTTNNGILKLTAYNSSIAKSGAPQGLDLSARFIPSASSPSIFGSGMTWGYRIVFGYRDANDNLILSAPSDIVTLTNSVVDNQVATAALTTITVTSPSHGLVSGMFLRFEGATGFTTSTNAEGTYQITVIDANTFSYTVGVAPGGGPGAVDYSYNGPVRLEFSVPSEISSGQGYFFQIYRSSQVSTGLIFSDFKLIDELELSSSEISARLVIYDDEIPDILLGAELYTNQNSREGELQANARAPLCEDVTLYKGHVIYANCTTRQLLDFNVIDATLLSSGDYIEAQVTGTRRYVARTGVGNKTVLSQGVSGAVTLTVTYTAHGFVTGDTLYISNVMGGTYANQTVTVSSSTANTVTFTATGSGSPTALEMQGVTNGTYPIFYLSQSTSASVRLRDTAQAIAKAMNRDGSSEIYAQYASGITDIPGKIRLQAKGFGPLIYLRANSGTAGAAFSPILPTTFSSVFSRNDELPHVFFASKQNEPEAVPLVNFFPVGARNKETLRVAALRDSLIIIKEDGVYRVTGDNVSNFSVTALDSTVECVAPSSVDVINNQVMFLAKEGVCIVTESSVQVVSRKIEDVIQPILGQTTIGSVTSGVGYESERLYMLTTSDPNDSDASHVWVYNILTEEWTEWDTLFAQAVVGPSDRLYYVSLDNTIERERKLQTRIDYCGANISVTISDLSSDLTSCTLTVPALFVPRSGDIVVKSDVINRISTTPVATSGTTYSVTFSRPTNFANADSLILYEYYTSTIKLAPFHAGLVGRTKQFAQYQVHFRDASSASRVTAYFIGPFIGGSASQVWTASFSRLGWGLFPWGFEPWGQGEGVNLQIGTQPAAIMRVYVPLYQQRVPWIQPYLEHSEAAESLGIQAMSFSVRAYGERVTR